MTSWPSPFVHRVLAAFPNDNILFDTSKWREHSINRVYCILREHADLQGSTVVKRNVNGKSIIALSNLESTQLQLYVKGRSYTALIPNDQSISEFIEYYLVNDFNAPM